MASSKIDEVVLRGIESLYTRYVDIQPQDTVVVIYTPDCRDQASLLVVYARELGNTVLTIPMSVMTDVGLPRRLSETLPTPEALIGRLVVIIIERDSMSHGELIRHEMHKYGDNVLPIRIINGSWDFFRYAVGPSAEELSAINSGLLHRFLSAKMLAITSSSGTELEVTLDNERYRWLSNRAMWHPGTFVILPAGEVATYPHSIRGRLVADGAFNVNKPVSLDARLSEHPLTVQIEHGAAKSWMSADARVEELFSRCMAHENGDRVGELGFGTNIGIGSFISMNSHINERHPGVHIGFGQHAQYVDVVPYYTDIHIDLITSDCTVYLDGDDIPISSATMAASDLPHPTNVNDEDLDVDCCGTRSHQITTPIPTQTES